MFQPDMNKLPLGQAVRAEVIYEKDRNNIWHVCLTDPIEGLLVGYRNLSNMRFESESGEYGEYYSSWWEFDGLPIPCALVVFHPRRNPVRVPIENLELVHSLWCGKCGWVGTDQDTETMGQVGGFMCGNEHCGYMAHDVTLYQLEQLQAPEGEVA